MTDRRAITLMENDSSSRGERKKAAGEGDLAIFERTGDGITVKAKTDVKLLVMDGEPFAEPVVGHGPFVMNSRAETQQAFEDYQLGRLGELA
jgi:redox-sensitive bicupin YhaK (pirin superfamily)